MSEYFSHTLNNGLRIVHKPNNSNVSYAGFIVNAGTRDEENDEFGMAHFIEHMLFKGTGKRSSRLIINRIESVGGELNAYTNKEETVLYSAFLEQHFERAFELMSDMIFNSDFPENEIEKEIDVIIDEIHSYEDSPSELIYDEFENLIFKDSQLGHNILGTEKSVLSFDSKKTKRFYSRYYIPSNMVFFTMGKTDFSKILKLAEKHLSGINPKKNTIKRIEPANLISQQIREKKETYQVHAVLGFRTCNMFNEKKSALYLLNNILGGPCMNSRLNMSLREKHGLVYNVESSITSYTDTGMLSIYFGTDEKNLNKCMNLIKKEIDKLQNTKLSVSQLESAKKQLIGQIGVSSDNNENVALALGKSFLHFNHFDSYQETFNKINNITLEDLTEISQQYLTNERFFSLIYH